MAARHASDELLVGLDVADDAAVYRLTDEQALVVTVDFFTPIVDDPFIYGGIAAANSLSDIYAMGATPLLALNVAGMPADLPADIVGEIFRGGAEKAREAGIVVAGGHTVRDAEPKYGLVVVGTVRPEHLKRKGGAAPGDQLFLSKRLGTGVISTALRAGRAEVSQVEASCRSMLELNRDGAALALDLGATAVTDVTGFGLLGHLSEMVSAGSVGFELSYASLPWLPGAERWAEASSFPGGAHDNEAYFTGDVRFAESIAPWRRTLCFSPETSGGLLMTLPPENARRAESLAAEQGLALCRVGVAVAEPVIAVKE
jgi:selenide,water dikinase